MGFVLIVVIKNDETEENKNNLINMCLVEYFSKCRRNWLIVNPPDLPKLKVIVICKEKKGPDTLDVR